MNAESNGIGINYKVDGREGAPWVTFITGIANDTTMWDGQVPELEQDFRLLRYDSRGHGGTQATQGDYSFDMLIDDLVGLWDALGINQSHLVGLGLGGSTAIGAGIQHPERLLSLAACCCRADMTPEFAAIWPGFIKIVKAQGMEGMVEPTVERWFTDDFKASNREVLDSVRAQIRGTDPLGYYGCIAAFLTLSFGDRIGSIPVPIAVFPLLESILRRVLVECICMAVTITIEELQAALRLGDTAEETAEVTRLLAYASEAVTKHAPEATSSSIHVVESIKGDLWVRAQNSQVQCG